MFKSIAMFALKNNKMAMSKFSRWKHIIEKKKHAEVTTIQKKKQLIPALLTRNHLLNAGISFSTGPIRLQRRRTFEKLGACKWTVFC